VNDYELLIMLDPEVPEERQNEILRRMRELLEGRGARWVGHEPWGRRRLAYEIEKKTDGIYHLVHFDAEAEALDEVTRVLRITDGVMRHLAVRRVKGVPIGRGAGAQARSEPPEPAAVGAGGYDTNTRSFQEEES
jgi:small subunit ribosomal protein S6